MHAALGNHHRVTATSAGTTAAGLNLQRRTAKEPQPCARLTDTRTCEGGAGQGRQVQAGGRRGAAECGRPPAYVKVRPASLYTLKTFSMALT